MDSLILLLGNYKHNETTDNIYYLARTIPSMGVSPQYSNRTFEQLKNSGMLRLIRNPSVLDSITLYYESLKDLDIRVEHRLQRLNNLFIASEELFDGRAFTAIADSGFKKVNNAPALLTTDKFSLSRYITRLGYYKATDKIIMNKIIDDYLPAAVNLITMLKKEYHLQ